MKTLHDMTDEERWAIFPIILSEPRPEWALRYQEEEAIILEPLRSSIARINHIGSTSVSGLLAKPTIDILIELDPLADVASFRKTMTAMGYLESSFNETPELHIMYLKGYTEHGFVGQVFHIHVRHLGDWNELYFRDYLREHPDVCKAYAAIKRSLEKKYKHHRDNYTNGKTDFILKYTKEARALYENKYKTRG